MLSSFKAETIDIDGLELRFGINGIDRIDIRDFNKLLRSAEQSHQPRSRFDWTKFVISLVQREGIDGAIAIRGTTFQGLVWAELASLRVGSTVSYKSLAESIGKSSAHRSVAKACAANRLALVVPCHRAIYDDGSIGGFRWGHDAKAAIIRFEASLM